MNYRYRVKGKVQKSFILRGLFFRIGANIDNCITEKELVFVKEHCMLSEIMDMQSISTAPKPIPTNSTDINRGVKNEQPSKPAIKTNKVRIATKV